MAFIVDVLLPSATIAVTGVSESGSRTESEKRKMGLNS